MIRDDERARPLRRVSASEVLSYLLAAAVALSALSAFPAEGGDPVGLDDEGQEETATGSIVLEIYLDGGERALIVGYLQAEGLEDLAFLQGFERFYDQDTGELYALGDGLTTVLGDGTRLTFEAKGWWEELHLAFHLPQDAEVMAVSCSEGLDYSVAEAEDSLAVEVLGCEVEGAEVVIDYVIS